MSGVEVCVGRAHAFVAAEGSEFDQLFLDTLLRERTAAELLEAVARLQQPDGSIPPLGGEPGAGAESTAACLERLDAVGLLDHPIPERAAAFLMGRQADDGGFGEVGDDDDLRIEQTGRLAGLLAKTPFARPSVLARAEAFLGERWSVERVQGPTYAPILAYTHLLTQMQSEFADEALQWCGRELERGFRLRAFSPLATARVFLRARAKSLPGATIDAAELVTALITEQADDGSFPTDAQAPSRVAATLEATEALLRLS